MSRFLSTLQIIGAVFGGYLLALLNNYLDTKKATTELSRITNQNYLLPAQDAAEALWFRIDNIQNQAGAEQMNQEYFRTSTIYAVGRVLAYARILQTEGIFISLQTLQNNLGTHVRDAFESFDESLEERVCTEPERSCFHRYVRIGLPELLIERPQAGSSRVAVRTYIDFAATYQDNPQYKAMLEPVGKFISELNNERMTKMLIALSRLVCIMSAQTQIPPAKGGIKSC